MRRLLVVGVVAIVTMVVGGLFAFREVAQSSTSVGTPPLASSAPSEPLYPPDIQYATWSIEDWLPSSVNGMGPFDPADILSLVAPGVPALCIPCANLGLGACSPWQPAGAPFDDMDALSYGADFGNYPSEDGYLGFSVDHGGTGLPGTGVNNETIGCIPPEPEADEFLTNLAVDTFGNGTNLQFADGDGIASCANPAAWSLGLAEPPPVGGPSDDLDAIGEKDCWEIDGDQNYIADREVYFSLTPASPSLPGINPPAGATPADILVYTLGGVLMVYAPEWQLGLGTQGPGDDVNGLCLAEVGWPPGHPDREYFHPDAPPDLRDHLFFTLEATSPTVMAGLADPGDILYVPSSGTFIIVDQETALGLIPADDVDAIKCIKGLVDISIDDYYITLPDGTPVYEGDPAPDVNLTVCEWTDFNMTEVKHYYGVSEELSPPSVTSQVGWAVIGPPPGQLNVRFNAQQGDICTDQFGAPVPCGEGGVPGVPWDPTTLPFPPPAGVDSCKDGIDNDGDLLIDFADPDCVDIYDVHFPLDLAWCDPLTVDREVQFHCKEAGDFPVTFQNIELPLGADDIDPESNEGNIDVIIVCEEATPTPTPTVTPTPTITPTSTITTTPTITPTNTATPPTPTPTVGPWSYQCYDIFPQMPPPVGVVRLETQFGEEMVEVGPNTELCAPALKWGEGRLDEPHLKCYDIWGSDPDAVVNLETRLWNSTVEENVEIGPARLLCMGASKDIIYPDPTWCCECPTYPMCFDAADPGICAQYGCAPLPGFTCLDPDGMCQPIPPPQPPADLHYECFDISATGHDPPGVVSLLQDQFGLKFDVDVGPAELLCAPALKDGIGTLDASHFKCYQIPPAFPGEYWMNLETQWGPEFDVQLGPSRWLCVAALKEVVECIDRLGDTQCDDPVNDPDDDGCSSWEEQSGAPFPKPGNTGAYDPAAWYDFYDVAVPAKPDAAGANGTRNAAVGMTDVLAVLFYVGTFDGDGGAPNPNGVGYDTVKGVDLDGDTDDDAAYSHGIKEGVKYDRSPSALPNPPWDAGPPNGAVAMSDVLAVLAQVGLACAGGPPP